MSAIGDYIHYSARAYEKYGTYVKGEGTYQKWHSQKGYILSARYDRQRGEKD